MQVRHTTKLCIFFVSVPIMLANLMWKRYHCDICLNMFLSFVYFVFVFRSLFRLFPSVIEFRFLNFWLNAIVCVWVWMLRKQYLHYFGWIALNQHRRRVCISRWNPNWLKTNTWDCKLKSQSRSRSKSMHRKWSVQSMLPHVITSKLLALFDPFYEKDCRRQCFIRKIGFSIVQWFSWFSVRFGSHFSRVSVCWISLKLVFYWFKAV